MRDHLLGMRLHPALLAETPFTRLQPSVFGHCKRVDDEQNFKLMKRWGQLPAGVNNFAQLEAHCAKEDDAARRIVQFNEIDHLYARPASGGPVKLVREADCKTGQAAPKPVVLTEGDAQADLNGTPRPDNPTVIAADSNVCFTIPSATLRAGGVITISARASDACKPAADAEGWIAHDGGPCPESVKGKTVEVRFRDGETGKAQACSAVFFNQPGAEGADVLAYRVIP